MWGWDADRSRWTWALWCGPRLTVMAACSSASPLTCEPEAGPRRGGWCEPAGQPRPVPSGPQACCRCRGAAPGLPLGHCLEARE